MPENVETPAMPEIMMNVLPPAEAGFSVNLFLNHERMGRVMFTFRGAMSTDWPGVMEELKAFSSYMSEKGWKFDGEITPKVQGVQKAPDAPAPASAPNAPAPAAAKGPAPAPEDIDTSINTMSIVKVKVEPLAGDRVKLHLFAKGHKFPDLYYQADIKDALVALAHTGYTWTEEHLTRAAEMNMAFDVDWRNSTKLNSKNQPYKNIVQFRAQDATA